MALYRNGAFVDDDWTTVADDAALPSGGRLLLSRTRYLSERDALAGRNEPVGIILRSGETLAGLEEDVALLGLIVLDIPKYADGRLYSVAMLARKRYGFTGELRASGDILRDQIVHLHRVGFSSFDIVHQGTIDALRQGTIIAVHQHYQPAAREQEELSAGQWPRERLSPPGTIPGTSK